MGYHPHMPMDVGDNAPKREAPAAKQRVQAAVETGEDRGKGNFELRSSQGNGKNGRDSNTFYIRRLKARLARKPPVAG
jgi:hypothetical protein